VTVPLPTRKIITCKIASISRFANMKKVLLKIDQKLTIHILIGVRNDPRPLTADLIKLTIEMARKAHGMGASSY
jgi:hypothetical protein